MRTILIMTMAMNCMFSAPLSAQVDATLNTLQQDLAEAETKVEHLLEKNAACTRDLVAAYEQEEAVAKKLAAEESENTELKGRLELAGERTAEMKANVGELEAELKQLNENITQTTEKATGIQTAVDALKPEHAALSKRLGERDVPKAKPEKPPLPSYKTVQEALDTVRFPSVFLRHSELPDITDWIGTQVKALATGPTIGFAWEPDDGAVPWVTLRIEHILLADLLKEICIQCNLEYVIAGDSILFVRKGKPDASKQALALPTTTK